MMRLVFFPKVVPNRQMIAELVLDPAQILHCGMPRDEYLRLALDVLTPSFTELWGCEACGVAVPDVAASSAQVLPVRAVM